MNNDKWLCTAKVFEMEDVGFGFLLTGPDEMSMRTREKHFLGAAQALKNILAETLSVDELNERFAETPHTAPTTPKTT